MKYRDVVGSTLNNIMLVIENESLDKKKEKIASLLTIFHDIIATSCIVQILRQSSLFDEENQILLKDVAGRLQSHFDLLPSFGSQLIERLSMVEHNQWISWSKAVASEVSEERRKRWESYWVEYEKLPESIKGSDRLWANVVMGEIYIHMQKSIYDSQMKFVEYLKYALNIHDQNQFDSDLINVYKNTVVNEVLDLMSGDSSHEENKQ